MAYSLPSSLAPEIGLWAGGQPCLALTITSVASSSNPAPGASLGRLWVGWGLLPLPPDRGLIPGHAGPSVCFLLTKARPLWLKVFTNMISFVW